MAAYLLPLTARELLTLGDALLSLEAYEDADTQDALLERVASLMALDGVGEEWCRFIGMGRSRGRRQG